MCISHKWGFKKNYWFFYLFRTYAMLVSIQKKERADRALRWYTNRMSYIRSDLLLGTKFALMAYWLTCFNYPWLTRPNITEHDRAADKPLWNRIYSVQHILRSITLYVSVNENTWLWNMKKVSWVVARPRAPLLHRCLDDDVEAGGPS